jgi:hypothetical protein
MGFGGRVWLCNLLAEEHDIVRSCRVCDEPVDVTGGRFYETVVLIGFGDGVLIDDVPNLLFEFPSHVPFDDRSQVIEVHHEPGKSLLEFRRQFSPMTERLMCDTGHCLKACVRLPM